MVKWANLIYEYGFEIVLLDEYILFSPEGEFSYHDLA
jgi:hypothetical protein